MCLGFSHHFPNPQPVLLVVFGKLDDVLSNPLCDGPRVDNVLFVGLENPHNFVDVVLVDFDLILQAGNGSL